MNLAIPVMLGFLTACSALPQIAQTVDDIATEDTLKVIVGKEAFERQKNINIIVEIQNDKKK